MSVCIQMHSARNMSSDDIDEMAGDLLAEELRNIESVIIVTRRNIDALNEKFANLQDPPAMYIHEYQELTSKLHELEAKKYEISERVLRNDSPDQPDNPDQIEQHDESLEARAVSLLF